MSFESDIKSTDEISHCFQTGKSAIKRGERAYFKCLDTRMINGSIDIDRCLEDKYPHDNRWDYAIGYNDKCYFVEIHPASTSDISTVIAKKEWVVKWLKSQSSLLIKREHSFHWIATGKISIRKGSPQQHRLNSSGIEGPKKSCICKN